MKNWKIEGKTWTNQFHHLVLTTVNKFSFIFFAERDGEEKEHEKR